MFSFSELFTLFYVFAVFQFLDYSLTKVGVIWDLVCWFD